MSEKFSATLRIGDLNDFIAPSQGCVVSMKSGSARLADKPKKIRRLMIIVNPRSLALDCFIIYAGCDSCLANDLKFCDGRTYPLATAAPLEKKNLVYILGKKPDRTP
ncbi:hypothetical protein HanIR_Chr00c21g0910081 [Helianthus annuus]|nr:hypothetical protein HanIR_Chr00c21g0910081 [Helianthus annuus]